jgi:2-hydroxychromene-2-carboxylate isomerase
VAVKISRSRKNSRLWARRDAELIAPHYGLEFPAEAGVKPPASALVAAGAELAKQSSMSFIAQLQNVSDRLWSSSDSAPREGAQAVEYSSEPALQAALDVGSARIAELNHYSGASLYYGGEWYWGVDRLFHLEQRLRDLGVCRTPDKPFLVPRPEIEVSDLDASQLQLHFYPSLNSPYTSIIFDRTVALAQACGIEFHHKPVLPMIMRGVAATQAKGRYIFFDTKREADFFWRALRSSCNTDWDSHQTSLLSTPVCKSGRSRRRIFERIAAHGVRRGQGVTPQEKYTPWG